jgi:hypothetical protein
MREDARLPRAGAGQDEQRPFAVGHGGALLGIEGVEDGVGQRFDGMCDSRLWMRRGKSARVRGQVGRAVVEKVLSVASALRQIARIPEELASGGGVSADAGASGFFCAVRHDESAVDNVLKS